MKLVLVLCTLLATSLPAQTPSASPSPTPTDYQVSTADIRAIEFETETGLLIFTVQGKRFAHRSEAHDNPAASVAAGYATLAELRRASTVTLRVWFNNDLPNPVYDVDRITFHYDTLKP